MLLAGPLGDFVFEQLEVDGEESLVAVDLYVQTRALRPADVLAGRVAEMSVPYLGESSVEVEEVDRVVGNMKSLCLLHPAGFEVVAEMNSRGKGPSASDIAEYRTSFFG